MQSVCNVGGGSLGKSPVIRHETFASDQRPLTNDQSRGLTCGPIPVTLPYRRVGSEIKERTLIALSKKRTYTDAEVDKIAEQTLKIYETQCGPFEAPPVPLAEVLTQVYGLTAQWDLIDEKPGEIILSGLQPKNQQIILNERHRRLFEGMIGLERFTLGHEAGHWEFHVYKPVIGQPRLPGLMPSDIFYKRNSRDHGVLEVFSGALCNQEIQKVASSLFSNLRVPSEDERLADRFASALLMPAPLLKVMADSYDFYRFGGSNGLYALAERFDVSLHALTARLQQLKYIYIDPHGKVHRPDDYPRAQRSLF